MRRSRKPVFRKKKPANEESAAKVSAPIFPSRDPSEASAEEESSPESENVESREASVPPEAAAPVGPSTEELVARSFEEGRRERRAKNRRNPFLRIQRREGSRADRERGDAAIRRGIGIESWSRLHRVRRCAVEGDREVPPIIVSSAAGGGASGRAGDAGSQRFHAGGSVRSCL